MGAKEFRNCPTRISLRTGISEIADLSGKYMGRQCSQERIILCGELERRNKFSQESRTQDCQET